MVNLVQGQISVTLDPDLWPWKRNV